MSSSTEASLFNVTPSPVHWGWRRCVVALVSVGLSAGVCADGTPSSAEGLTPQQVIQMGSAPAPRPNDVPVLLSVQVNQMPQTGWWPFQDRQGRLWAKPGTLQGLGVRHLPAAQDGWVDLMSVPGWHVRYEPHLQQLTLDLPVADLDLPATHLNAVGQASRPEEATSSAPFGMLLNYDVYGTRVPGSQDVNVQTEWRTFARHWVFSSTQWWESHPMVGAPSFRRLDTFFRQSLLDTGTALTLGDTLSATGAAGRPVRMGGVQWSKDYSLDPTLVTTPLSVFQGSATVPSNVELFVNGIKQYEHQVPAGPFTLSALPAINGAGDAQVVLTDLAGRQQTLSLPFYATTQLLAPGLSTWSVNVGKVRENYGLQSNNYQGPWFASGAYRQGWTSQSTLGVHATASAHLQVLGGQWDHRVGAQGGVLSMGVQGSQGQNHWDTYQQAWIPSTGWAANVAYTWQSPDWVWSVSQDARTSGFTDLPATLGTPLPLRTTRATLGMNWHAAGNVGLTYVNLTLPHAPASRYLVLNWSKSSSHGGNWSVTLTQNLVQRSDLAFFVGWSWHSQSQWDTSVSLDGARGQSAHSTVVVDRPITNEQGWGYRFVGSQGGGLNSQEVDVSQRAAAWEDRFALVHTPQGMQYAGEVRGALTWVGGQTFWGRQNQDSFAVVSTAPYAHVPVYIENRLWGETNTKGYALISNLQPWQANQIRLDPLSLPANVEIPTVSQSVVPPALAGSWARFDLKAHRAILMTLHNPAGQPVTLGSQVSWPGGQAMVGYDGQVYLDHLPDRPLQLRILSPSGHRLCQIDLPSTAKSGKMWTCSPGIAP